MSVVFKLLWQLKLALCEAQECTVGLPAVLPCTAACGYPWGLQFAWVLLLK